MLIPGGFGYAARVPVMEWLSQDAQVRHVSWNLTGGRFLEYVANRWWLAIIRELDPHALHGADPPALQDAAAALEGVAAARWLAQAAAVMAVIEARTGARLPGDWFDEPRQVAAARWCRHRSGPLAFRPGAASPPGCLRSGTLGRAASRRGLNCACGSA